MHKGSLLKRRRNPADPQMGRPLDPLAQVAAPVGPTQLESQIVQRLLHVCALALKLVQLRAKLLSGGATVPHLPLHFVDLAHQPRLLAVELLLLVF